MGSVSLGITGTFGRASVCTCLTYLVLALTAPAARADKIRDAVNKVSTDQYRTYQTAIENMGLGFYGGPAYNQGYRSRYGWANGGTLGNQEARLCLTDQFTSMGLTVSTRGICGNVVAEWPGTETPQEIYIVCAHYDTTSGGKRPGGDDNASGTAGVLEAARVLTQYRFKSTLRFIAFNMEEDWPKGSQEYVDALPWDANILGVVNLDMILRPAWDSDPQEPVDLELESGNVPNCAAWIETFVCAAATYVPSLAIDPNSHYPYDWNWGDQGPFIWAGYATFTAIENTADEMWDGGSNLYYHTAQDASDALANSVLSPSSVTYDYDFAANVVRATVATLATRAGLVSPCDPNAGEGQTPATDPEADPESAGGDSRSRGTAPAGSAPDGS